MKRLIVVALCSISCMAFSMDESRHVAMGMECVDCHGENITKFTNESVCLDCHEEQSVIDESVIDARPNHSLTIEPDPHFNVHFGNTLNCTACHSEHSQSKLYCNYCHQFNYPMFNQE